MGLRIAEQGMSPADTGHSEAVQAVPSLPLRHNAMLCLELPGLLSFQIPTSSHAYPVCQAVAHLPDTDIASMQDCLLCLAHVTVVVHICFTR